MGGMRGKAGSRSQLCGTTGVSRLCQAHGSTLVTRGSGQERCRWWVPSALVKTESRGNAIMVEEGRSPRDSPRIPPIS